MPRMRPASVLRRTRPVTVKMLLPPTKSSSSPLDAPASLRRTRWPIVVRVPALKLNEPRPTDAPYTELHSDWGATSQTALFAEYDGGR